MEIYGKGQSQQDTFISEWVCVQNVLGWRHCATHVGLDGLYCVLNFNKHVNSRPTTSQEGDTALLKKRG